MSNFSITVNNNSGAFQKYALVVAKPQISGQVQGQVWSTVFATLSTPPGNTATLNLSNQYSAVLGTTPKSPSDGTPVTIQSTKQVSLGSTTSSGSNVPGSTVSYITQGDGDSKWPSFAQDNLSSSGQTGAFALQTTGPFSFSDAKNNNWVVGVGQTFNGQPIAAAVFTPNPNVTYQIKPKNAFYLATGQFSKGDLIDPNQLGQRLEIDFSSQGVNPRVTINNTPDGQLVIQDN